LLVVGPVRHNLIQGDGVWGVTLLDNLIYVLRDKTSQQIAVYDAESYRLQRKITAPRLYDSCDMAACPYYQCLYVPGVNDQLIHRVALYNDCVTTWSVNDTAKYLSVTDTHSVLVTCQEVRKIKEFSTDGKLLREIQLQQNVVRPRHTIQLTSGEFLVCHGDVDIPLALHHVCLIGSDGHVIKSFGGREGSGTQRLNMPSYLAVDRNGFVFVADADNCRVLLLSPALTFVREVLSREQLKWKPLRMCLDSDRSRLYIGVNEWEDDHYTRGRVVVVDI